METQSLLIHRRLGLTVKDAAMSDLSQASRLVGGMVGGGLSLITGRRQSTHARLVNAFVGSLTNGAEVPVTAQEGRESVRVMTMIAQQLEDQKA
jgi:hypothetical protein